MVDTGLLVQINDQKEMENFVNNESFIDLFGIISEKFPKEYGVSHFCSSRIGGFRMFTFILKKKKKGIIPTSIRRGYTFSYSYNLDCPTCSELGDCYIDKNESGNFFRV